LKIKLEILLVNLSVKEEGSDLQVSRKGQENIKCGH